ncbi:MAG: hypothetical protein QM674_22405 [Burkholderiaceae bacterium]
MAVPAIGYVPWRHDDGAQARPAQIQTLSRVDTSAPGSGRWAELRGKAQGTLDHLTARRIDDAKASIGQLAESWRADKAELPARLPGNWEQVDKALQRASQRLNAARPELLLSKAAVLDVLSAVDAATAAAAADVVKTTDTAKAAEPAAR